MPLEHLEHFLNAAEDIDETVDWCVEVLGLEAGGAKVPKLALSLESES
jgi:hypothetical protein